MLALRTYPPMYNMRIIILLFLAQLALAETLLTSFKNDHAYPRVAVSR